MDETKQYPYRVSRSGVHSNTFIFTWMAVSALISLIAAFNLTLVDLKLEANPNVELACDLNSALSCGKVGLSWQAKLLGFPNSLLGLMFEPVVIAVSLLGLSGMKFPRWFAACGQGLYTIALLFAYWLFYQSYFYIGALCPWCLLVTLSTTVVFMTLLHFNIREDNLYLPRSVQDKLARFTDAHGITVATLVILAILVAMIIVKYGPMIF